MGMFLRRGPAPKLGTPIGSLDVGATVKFNVNGTAREFLVVHQGLPSTLYDASCDGSWLLMKDIYEQRQWHSLNDNAYETSTINTYLGGDFLTKFDSNVQNAIKQVKIPYCVGAGTGATVMSGTNGLPCKGFLLGGFEVGWVDSGFQIDGAKLDYFTANSTGNSKRVATYNGSAVGWWLRTPFVTGQLPFVLSVNADGSNGRNAPRVSIGVRPAFILLASFKLTEDMLVV